MHFISRVHHFGAPAWACLVQARAEAARCYPACKQNFVFAYKAEIRLIQPVQRTSEKIAFKNSY